MNNPHCSLTTGSCYDADIRKKYKQRIRGKTSTHAYMAKREGYVDGIANAKGKTTSRITYCWIDYCPSCQTFCEEMFLPELSGTVKWEMTSHSGGFSGERRLKDGETKFDAIERIRKEYPYAKICPSDNLSYHERNVKVFNGFNEYHAIL